MYEAPQMIKVNISSNNVFAQYSTACDPITLDVEVNGVCAVNPQPMKDEPQEYYCYITENMA